MKMLTQITIAVLTSLISFFSCTPEEAHKKPIEPKEVYKDCCGTKPVEWTKDNGIYLFIPNAFTPNGDGVNDLFVIEGTPADQITLYNLRIYDRWGQEVFTSDKITDLWNGKRNNAGEDCPDGTYVWVIYYEKSDKTKVTNKGSITLIR